MDMNEEKAYPHAAGSALLSRGIIENALSQGRAPTEPEAWEIMEAYGIAMPPHRLVRSAGEAAEAAEALGCPLVLKVVSRDILHKSEAGGVRLGLESADAAREAYIGIMDSVAVYHPRARIEGALAYGMLPAGGVECIVGMTRDPSFGPAMMVGLGGVYVEILKDVALRVLPISKADAEEMVNELKGVSLLKGARGAEPSDVGALADVIMKAARIAEENPRIMEIDLNPCIVYGKGAFPVDARILT